MNKGGFTLLELLISVTIFSGLVIIVLGGFARSASSTAKTALLREKNQTARTLIDQVTTDFEFIDTTREVVDIDTTTHLRGFALEGGGDDLVMLLHYPTAPDNQYVRKEYKVTFLSNDSARLTLTLNEHRDCSVAGTQLNCTGPTGGGDLLNSRYALNNDTNSAFETKFSGLVPASAVSQNPPVNGYLSISLTVKPLEYKNIPCSSGSGQQVPGGVCYKVETTLNAAKL